MNSVTRGASLAVLIALTGGASQAAITADQLWATWQDAGARVGLSVTAASSNREGNALRLTGVSIGGSTAGAAAATATIDELLLTESVDGTVTVVPSPEVSIAGGDDTDGADVTLRHQGGSIRVTENLGVLTYDMTAGEIAGDVAASTASSVPATDGTEARSEFAMTMVLANPVVTVTDTPDVNRTITFDIATDEVRYEIQASDAGLGTRSEQTSTTADVALTGSLALPRSLALSDLSTPEAWAAAFTEGMAIRFDATQGVSQSTAVEENAFAPMDLAATAQPGTAAFALSKDGYDLRATGEGLQVIFQTATLPIPQVQVDTGALEIAMVMPIMAGTAPGPFGLTLKFADIVVNDEAWGLIDPNAQLPRDPAQLSLVSTGTMLIDFLALLAAENAGMTELSPPQPLTLEIPELNLSAAGAVLDGTGSFTFDNATGTPIPAGEANITLTGGNRLIDALVAIGVLTEQDAGGARMMIAMFMNATGDDVLTSKIEAEADGSITVNGQRIQ